MLPPNYLKVEIRKKKEEGRIKRRNDFGFINLIIKNIYNDFDPVIRNS